MTKRAGQDGSAEYQKTEDRDRTDTDNAKYVSTGISGLDEILDGGFLRRGFYLVQGDPGSGKTTLALQFSRKRLHMGETVLYVSVTESRRDLERTAESHGWQLDGIAILDLSKDDVLQAKSEASSLFHPAEIELGQTVRAILEEVDRVQPDNVIFDGLGELRMLAGDAFTYRRQVLALKNFFEERNITVLLLDDRSTQNGQTQPETLVGANILLERTLPGYGGARRRASVTKVRGGFFRSGYHDYEILNGQGVVLYPRLVAQHDTAPPRRESFSSDLPGLDQLTGGGLQTGTTTLILGPAGVGKSTVAMQFVAAALQRGIPAAFYTFDEVLETFFERSEKLTVQGIRQYAASGLLHTQQVNPAELSPGSFAHEVQRSVSERGTRIVVIDSLNGYISAMPEERFLQTHLHELFTYLAQQGVVSIMVVAQHGLLSPDMSYVDVSYLADTVLLMRYFEASGEIRQAISVLKKRTGGHERTLRQLRITETGLEIGLPLRDFAGIMTGVPQYLGRETMLKNDWAEGAERSARNLGINLEADESS